MINLWNTLFPQNNGISYNDICCSRAFFPVLYFKGNSGAFIERLEPGCIDSGVMNAYISTIFSLNEAIAFGIIKPRYDPIVYRDILLPDTCSWFHA